MNIKILIIHPEGNIHGNPNLFYFTRELVNIGYDVTIFSRLRPEIFQGRLFKGAEFVFFTSNRAKNIKVKKSLLKKKYSHIIGIDTGIIDASKLASVMNIPYSFLSYEIFFDKELDKLNNQTDLKNKRKSKKACKNIQFAIVQDKIRKELLAKEYDIELDKILLMPVSGSGIRKVQKSEYFHKRLQISTDKNILLYMGWMDEIQLNRLLKYVTFMPENWAMVVHSRYKYTGKIPEGFPADKIYFSLDEPVESIDDIGVLLSGCNAGFCSYQASFHSPFTGDNITYIGLSSGKTTTFLQYGIPVVIENMNLWDEIVKQEKIGILLEKQSDLKGLDNLLSDATKQSCISYFDKQLDIKNFIEPIIYQIQLKSNVVSKTRLIKYLLFLLEERFFIAKKQLKKIKLLITN